MAATNRLRMVDRMVRKPLTLPGIGQLVTDHALRNKSTLYQWLHDNFAELQPVLSVRRPSWTALAAAAAEAGQVASDGRPHSRQLVWRTWTQVVSDMGKRSPRPTAPVTRARTETQPPAPTPPTGSLPQQKNVLPRSEPN